MTPYEIHIALAIYCSPSNWRDNIGHDMTTDHWYQTIKKFRDLDFLRDDDMCSEKLRVYVLALQEMPMPVQKWVMPKVEDLS